MLLIPTFLLLISPINFTIYLQRHTKHSATIFFVIHSFGKIFRVLIILGLSFHDIDELLRFL
jgi:hypothetical protein